MLEFLGELVFDGCELRYGEGGEVDYLVDQYDDEDYLVVGSILGCDWLCESFEAIAVS